MNDGRKAIFLSRMDSLLIENTSILCSYYLGIKDLLYSCKDESHDCLLLTVKRKSLHFSFYVYLSMRICLLIYGKGK